MAWVEKKVAGMLLMRPGNIKVENNLVSSQNNRQGEIFILLLKTCSEDPGKPPKAWAGSYTWMRLL